MGKLFIPAEDKIQGPWLLSRNDFEKLGETIEIIFEKLNSALKQDIEKNPDEYKYSKPKLAKNIVLTSKNKSKIFDTSILGLLKDQKLNELKPKEIYIEIGKKYSGFAFLLSITSDYNGTLDYSVECKNEIIKDEIKYEIDNWLENLKPNRVSQIWSNFLPYLLVPLASLWLIVLINFLFITPSDSFKNELKVKADSLITSGINKENEIEAIEIILKLQTEYSPDLDNYKTTFRPKVLKIILISTFCFFILFITPKTTIGIGKYKQKLMFYKFWKKFVLISLPSVIVLPNIIQLINDYIFK